MRRPRRTPRAWNKFGHFLPYHRGNDLVALDLCEQAGLKRIDIDVLMSKNRVLMATHWDLPLQHGFRDPLHLTRKNRRVSSMSYRHLSRLRAGKYRMRTLAAILTEAGRRGITVELDIKHDPRFNLADMRRLERLADRCGCAVVVKTTTDLPGAAARLRAARDAGLTTIVLPRGDLRLSKRVWWPAADYVRGPVRWVA